jgi:hypothetical protein
VLYHLEKVEPICSIDLLFSFSFFFYSFFSDQPSSSVTIPMYSSLNQSQSTIFDNSPGSYQSLNNNSFSSSSSSSSFSIPFLPTLMTLCPTKNILAYPCHDERGDV